MTCYQRRKISEFKYEILLLCPIKMSASSKLRTWLWVNRRKGLHLLVFGGSFERWAGVVWGSLPHSRGSGDKGIFITVRLLLSFHWFPHTCGWHFLEASDVMSQQIGYRSWHAITTVFWPVGIQRICKNYKTMWIFLLISLFWKSQLFFINCYLYLHVTFKYYFWRNE